MKILGFTDNKTTCEKCGKNNLKGTFILIDENNNDYYFGSECVKKTIKNVEINKSKAKASIKQFVLCEAHIVAVNSNDYDYFFLNEVNRLNKKYYCEIKL